MADDVHKQPGIGNATGINVLSSNTINANRNFVSVSSVNSVSTSNTKDFRVVTSNNVVVNNGMSPTPTTLLPAPTPVETLTPIPTSTATTPPSHTASPQTQIPIPASARFEPSSTPTPSNPETPKISAPVITAGTSLKLKRLEVVGDSALIIRQLQDYRPPRNKILRNIYTRARRLADQLCIRRWAHHVRAHNKMADLLANLAMDSRSSSQVLHPTTRDGHSHLLVMLYNDLHPWLAASAASSVEL